MDTNILISAVLFENGNEARILEEAIETRVTLLAGVETLEEFLEVLSRPKFRFASSDVLNVFQGIVGLSEVVLGSSKADVECRDPDDQKFLDCATAGGADYLVTGDPDLLSIQKIGRTRIVTATSFLRILKGRSG